MADEEADVADKSESSPATEAADSKSPDDKSDKEEGQAKKGEWSNNFKELQGVMTKQAQENAALRAELELLKTSTTGKLAELENRKSESQENKVDPKELDAKWIETIENGGAKGILDLVKNAVLDVRDMVHQEYEGKLNALQERLEQVDPDYLGVKEKADKLVKSYGIDRKTAVRMVKDQMKGDDESETAGGNTAGVRQPPRNRPPGRTGGVAITDDSDNDVQEVSPGEETESYLRAIGGTEKDLKSLRLTIGKGLKGLRHDKG